MICYFLRLSPRQLYSFVSVLAGSIEPDTAAIAC